MGVVHSKCISVTYSLEEAKERIVQVDKWTIGCDEKRPIVHSLGELVAKGYAFCHRVEDWPANAPFQERQVEFEIRNVTSARLDLTLTATCEMPLDVYDQIHPGEEVDCTGKYPCHVVHFKQLPPGPNRVAFTVYTPQMSLQKRVLNLFLTTTKDRTVVLKARCLIVGNDEFASLDAQHVGEETMAERTSRLQRLVSELSERTFFGIYERAHLERALLLAESSAPVPVRFWYAPKGSLFLAYKLFACPLATIKANVVVVATDSVFVDALARDLSAVCDVYVCYPRGFGPSEGPRGISEHREDLWRDYRAFLEMVQWNGRPTRNLIAAGHFWGASMLIKYAQWPQRINPTGYVLLAPNLGKHFFRPQLRMQLQRALTASTWRKRLWALTGGLVMGTQPRLRLQSDPMVKQLDPTMTEQVSLNTFHAWHMHHGQVATFLRSIRPHSIVIYGEQDEFHSTDTVRALVPDCTILPDVDNLTVIDASAPTVLGWLDGLRVSDTASMGPQASNVRLRVDARTTTELRYLQRAASRVLILTADAQFACPRDTTCLLYELRHMPLIARYVRLNSPTSIVLLDGITDDDSVLRSLDGLIGESQSTKLPCYPLSLLPEAVFKTEVVAVTATLADFDLQRLLGKGSFGTVWLAKPRTATNYSGVGGSLVALKIVPKSRLQTQLQAAAIRSEVQILLRLLQNQHSSHDWFVQLRAYGQDEHNVYMATEFVSGGELFVRFRRRDSKLPLAVVQRVVRQVAAALQCLHSDFGVVYRDLKPENVMITAQGALKLIDFGFAAIKDADGLVSGFCGSPYYIAPEMLTDATYSSRVDWWALGVLAYELLTGEPPFRGKKPHDVYKRILMGTVDFGKVPLEAQGLVKGLLMANPVERFAYPEIVSDPWMHGVDVEDNPFVAGEDAYVDKNFVQYGEEEIQALRAGLLDSPTYPSIDLP